MIHLKPISLDNINDFNGTSYDKMTLCEKQTMISDSIHKIHDNQYFEFLVVYKDDIVVGFMNLFAHSKHIISCGPTIKDEFQGRGFAFEAETLALKYASQSIQTRIRFCDTDFPLNCVKILANTYSIRSVFALLTKKSVGHKILRPERCAFLCRFW